MVMLIALLVVFALGFLWAFLSNQALWICAFVTLLFSMPVLLILKVILKLIPCGEKTVAVCCNCGEEFEI